MVSFSCESCGDIMTKKKLDPHKNRCRGSTFTCIDCMTHFLGFDYRSHTSCISEAQKYQGKLYKEKPAKGKGKAGKHGNAATLVEAVASDAAVNETRDTAATGQSVDKTSAAAADTASTAAARSETLNSGKKRKRDESAATEIESKAATAIDTLDDNTKASKKTKRAKKEKSVGSGEIAAEEQPESKHALSSTKNNTVQEPHDLPHSFLVIAKKELATKDVTNMAKIIKKWQKKNAGAAIEKLWKTLKVRRNGENELMIGQNP